MLGLILVIIVVWGCLLGGAYVLRAGGWSRPASAAITTGLYGLFCVLALLWFGPNQSAALGAFGMLLPYVVALVLIRIGPLGAR